VKKRPKSDPVERRRFELTPEEIDRFEQIRYDIEGEAIEFWGTVATARGLDYRTIIGTAGFPHRFSGLPKGHGKHWCWPSPLVLKTKPGDLPLLKAEQAERMVAVTGDVVTA
jgi:hypothetical protein